ncbi:hypothetical protein ACMU_05575 [Actibacterium mucosum KCTC 23349]|uniref:HTH arsR-type domain-containing protein n=1 Tax=Actibacterium mucosum KCTC 23349 TaxID=1454373 RepID=A0A037ZLC7_9RHOB|nr:metalloregulator ArsR/SmtB family transcription factor [Actibacterium mucosum]KAJ56414.1 hypothetical protein ACMU_05575 [Actibacterium mucosum KCTC 23349]
MHAAQSRTDEQLRALADPTRRAIVAMVAQGEHPAGRIAESFAMTRPAVSRHLRVLRLAGLIAMREDGTQKLYTADLDTLRALSTWFAGFWDTGLPRLKDLAETEAKST